MAEPRLLTVEWVFERVVRIAELAGDDEAAHGAEDDLHQAVLSAIAKGECADPEACAREALKTLDIDFARWCA